MTAKQKPSTKGLRLSDLSEQDLAEGMAAGMLHLLRDVLRGGGLPHLFADREWAISGCDAAHSYFHARLRRRHGPEAHIQFMMMASCMKREMLRDWINAADDDGTAPEGRTA